MHGNMLSHIFLYAGFMCFPYGYNARVEVFPETPLLFQETPVNAAHFLRDNGQAPIFSPPLRLYWLNFGRKFDPGGISLFHA